MQALRLQDVCLPKLHVRVLLHMQELRLRRVRLQLWRLQVMWLRGLLLSRGWHGEGPLLVVCSRSSVETEALYTFCCIVGADLGGMVRHAHHVSLLRPRLRKRGVEMDGIV